MNAGVAWIILITDTYVDSRAFYTDVIGFSISREVPEDEFCQFTLPNCTLALFGRAHVEKLLSAKYVGKGGGAIYTFPESTDIDADYRALTDKGVVFIKEPTTQPWGQRTAYFTDPDGHIWELQQWMKK